MKSIFETHRRTKNEDAASVFRHFQSLVTTENGAEQISISSTRRPFAATSDDAILGIGIHESLS